MNQEIPRVTRADIGLKSEDIFRLDRRMTLHRNLKMYQALLHWDASEFIGKVVLDIGQGRSECINEARALGVKMIGLDAHADVMSDVDMPRGSRVVGLAESLPIKDESVDSVVSSYGVPLYSGSIEHAREAFVEMVRVLKKGGTATLYPVVDQTEKTTKEAISWLQLNKFPARQRKDVLAILESIGGIEVEYYEQEPIDNQDYSTASQFKWYGIKIKKN